MSSPLSPELRQLVKRNANVASLYKQALSYLSDSSSDSGLEPTLCHSPVGSSDASSVGSYLEICAHALESVEGEALKTAVGTAVPFTPNCAVDEGAP